MFMKRFAINSSKESQKGEEIEVEPFKLNNESYILVFDFGGKQVLPPAL